MNPPPPRQSASTAAVAVALLIVYVVWGSTYLAIAVMIETLPPLLAAGIRFLIAGAIMLIAVSVHQRWLRRSDEPIERPSWIHWRSAAIIGALLLLGGNGGVVLAELRIPSGVAAVLVATMPIWMAFFEAALFRRRPTVVVIGGLVAGIIGVAVLMAPAEGVAALDPIGILLVVGGAMAWALGSIYAQHAPMPRSGLLGTGMEMLAGGAALVLGGLLLGEQGRIDVSAFSTSSILALGYLILFGSILAFTSYTWLLAHTPTTVAGTYAYVNPLVAVALGAILLREPITPRTLIATVLIVAAVVALMTGRRRDEPGIDPAPVPVQPDDARGDRAAVAGTDT
ncbi:MAG TPA: EamA family transporter [Candidatus Limnocylindria bacterium]|nr:EamA family transporter [Candidatus Limnocylindria bacterium]